MMRITTDSAYSCTLLGIGIGVYGSAHVNEPGLRVLLYDVNDVPIDSVDLAWDLLMNPDEYGELHRCIFPTTAEYKRFRQVVVNVV